MRKKLEEILEQTVNHFLKNDGYLISIDANERTLTHKFAEYLQLSIGNSWNVDCEYNRYGENSKTLDSIISIVGTDTTTSEIKTKTIYPDIIVHKRGIDGQNILVIEAKKDATDIEKENDIRKIEKIQNEYKYYFGCFINFKTKDHTIEYKVFDKSVEFAIQSIRERSESFCELPMELRSNKEVALEAVKRKGWMLRDTSLDLQSDREVVLVAVKSDICGGRALEYASKELRLDPEIVSAAIHAIGYTNFCFISSFIDPKFWNDKYFILEMAKVDTWILEHASNQLKNDPEFIALASEMAKNN